MEAIDQLQAVLCNADGRCCIAGSDEDRKIVGASLAAIRAELAKPQAEPVGSVYEIHMQTPAGLVVSQHALLYNERPAVKHNDLLYAAPVRQAVQEPQAEPVAWLKKNVDGDDISIPESNLRTKQPAYVRELWANATPLYAAPQAQPQAEPVAMVFQHGATVRLDWYSVHAAHNCKPGPLFAAPQAQPPEWIQRQAEQRGVGIVQPAVPYFQTLAREVDRLAAQDAAPVVPVPLTLGKIADAASAVWEYYEDDIDRLTEFARAIEQAHGIKGDSNG